MMLVVYLWEKMLFSMGQFVLDEHFCLNEKNKSNFDFIACRFITTIQLIQITFK